MELQIYVYIRLCGQSLLKIGQKFVENRLNPEIV